MKEQPLIQEVIDLPDDFDIKDFKLFYRDIDLLRLSKENGTPLRFTFLPDIEEKIKEMKFYFKAAIQKTDYQGTYTYYYCTKSSHFKHVLEKAIQSHIGIEISSAYDIDLIKSLIEDASIKRGTKIICNGYKTPEYLTGISSLIQQDYCSVMPIIDSKSELFHYLENISTRTCLTIGMRINLTFLKSYNQKSRFGLSPEDIINHYQHDIKTNNQVSLTTLHFFNEKGLDTGHEYWDVLEEVVRFYCRVKRLNPRLSTLDIGGGMPFRSSLSETLDLSLLVLHLVSTIKNICAEECVQEPDIMTEFGKYTVAEATATIFKINEKKPGNRLDWAIIDGSFITHLPDTWAIQQQYPVFAINNLKENNKPYLLGGLTCDSSDYYPNTRPNEYIMLPDTDHEQYIIFLHTGAYQEALSGFGGANHCLIPSPKHIIIDRDDHHDLQYTVFSDKQTSDHLLKILGYRK
jgi:arginine decarboxylase